MAESGNGELAGEMTPAVASTYTLSARQVAEVFSVGSKTVARWAQAGLLPAIRTPGGHRRYRESDVAALLNRHID